MAIRILASGNGKKGEFLEKQGYDESPVLSSHWESSPNYPLPRGAVSETLQALLNLRRLTNQRARLIDNLVATGVSGRIFSLDTGKDDMVNRYDRHTSSV